MSSSIARREILPRYAETVLCAEHEPGAVRIHHSDELDYFVRPMCLQGEQNRADGEPRWKKWEYSRYPIILCGNGVPWYEANMWVRHILMEKADPLSSTRDIAPLVDDLVAYRRFIEEYGIDWLDFSEPLHMGRPTYRFQTQLSDLVIGPQTISWTTAHRRMGTVVRFYRWLRDEAYFKPAKFMWREKEVLLPLKSDKGFRVEKKVKTTDLKVKGKPKEDPFDNSYIDDGGKLRPLDREQQKWVFEALQAEGNRELQLIHWLSWFTGARIQTALTFRRNHVWQGWEKDSQWGAVQITDQGTVRIRVGPGTGIDTKYDKNFPLDIPLWLYKELHTYVHSTRATKRRSCAPGGDIAEQYLFLTVKGNPLYVSMQANEALEEKHSHRRHHFAGQAVGQLIRKRIIPAVRSKHDPQFTYRYHDLRGTFGMNEIERLVGTPKNPRKPDGPKWTIMDAAKHLQARLAHERLSTTEGYVKFRERPQWARGAQDLWEGDLERMAQATKIAGAE